MLTQDQGLKTFAHVSKTSATLPNPLHPPHPLSLSDVSPNIISPTLYFALIKNSSLNFRDVLGNKEHIMENSTSAAFHSRSQRVIAWCVAYSLVAVVTVTGNVMTIAFFAKTKLPCRYGCYVLINLAIADLMVGVLALPMYIAYLIYAFTYTTIKINLLTFQHVYTAVDMFTGLASVITMASIALQRLYAVTFPLKYRITTEKSYFGIISLVWVISGTVSITYILSGAVFSLLPNWTFTYYMTGISVLSLFIICAAYVGVWTRIHLWNQRKIESPVSSQEKQLAAALFIVTVVFILTWSPFHILNILVNFKCVHARIPIDLIFLGKLLHYINSVANPAIYSLKIPQFRIVVRRMFCKNWVPETRV